MRISSYLLAFAILAVSAAPALAGTVEYADLRGRWVSSNCPEPQQPSLQARDSESPADKINRLEQEKHAYAEALRAHMDCVSQEAQRDIDAISLMITQSAQNQINQAQTNWAAVMGAARNQNPAPSVVVNQ